MSFLKRPRSPDEGWLAMSMQAGTWSFAQVDRAGARWRVRRCGTRTLVRPGEGERVAKELGVAGARSLSLLSPGEYQLLLVDAPAVPAAELRSALRWKVKDLLDYPAEDAAIEMLDIPPAPASRSHSMYAIAAPGAAIKECIAQFNAARIPLAVIDIPETAQRNIAALFEAPERALALLHCGPDQTLLTVNYRAELYLARRFETGIEALCDAPRAEEARERVLLEVQRSFDHFERQFPQLGIARLLLSPEPEETGLQPYLAANLDVPVERARLEEVLDWDPGCPSDAATAWRHFHLVGAALRPAQSGALQ